jgi:class 3 adenylate cyclase/tetratricopeptide (TPR) repeat protein
MQCPRCHSECSAEFDFCPRCGTALHVTCPHCGFRCPSELRLCPKCATALATPAGAGPEIDAQAMLNRAIQRHIPKEYAERLLATRGQPHDERRTVTILFSDVKGSTALAENLDPEDVKDIIRGVFEFLIGAVYRYEGTVVQLMGDAILAFFGAPIAHEDDPERACRAALDIAAEAAEYAERLHKERGIAGFGVRVGINTGLVVVGELGSDLRVAYTAVGDAINLAARMEEAAEPGTVLISHNTFRLVAPLFETQALGPLRVKGKSKRVHVYRVLSARMLPDKGRGVPGLDSPMVGRETELATLREAVAGLSAGRGGVVSIVGEAGLGKSRLVAEVRGTKNNPQIAQITPIEKTRWVEGRCLSYGMSVAYQLWKDVLRGLLGVTQQASPAALREALQRCVADLCPQTLAGVYPYLAGVLSVPLDEGAGAATGDLDPAELQKRTFRALEELLGAAARRQPLVVVGEDLHWADATSLQVLQQLVPLTQRVPLLLICVLRPVKDHGSWSFVAGLTAALGAGHAALMLEPLSPEYSETLVTNLLHSETLPDVLRQRILSRAEGNPFYIEEVIRSLIDLKVLARNRAGAWTASRTMVTIPIPDTLQGVLVARIDRLPDTTRRVLQMAAVIGRIFLERLLGAMTGAGAELEGHLQLLQYQELIRERAQTPELEYIFKHDMTREAAYNGLLKKERRVYHRQAAEAIERLFADRIEDQVELLALHWQRADEPWQATGYLLRAGDRASHLGASWQAIEFYRAALKLAVGAGRQPRVPPHAIHEKLGDVFYEHLSRQDDALAYYQQFLQSAQGDEEAARAARKLAALYLLRGDVGQAHRHYQIALARLRELPPGAEACRVHYGLAYLFVSRNELEPAQEQATLSMDAAQRSGDRMGQADAFRMLGIIASQKRQHQVALDYDLKSLELYRVLADLPRLAHACNNVGDSYRQMGDTVRALEYLREGLQVAQTIGSVAAEAMLRQTTGELLLDLGEWQKAAEELELARAAATQCGVVGRIIGVRRPLGVAYEALGRLDQARAELEAAENLMWETHHLRFGADLYLDLAHLKATVGSLDEAERCVARAVKQAGPGASPAFRAVLHRCRGYLAARRGRWERAVVELEESLRLLGQDGVPFPVEEGRTRLELAAAYAGRGESEDAALSQQELQAARALFERVGATGYLERLKEPHGDGLR